MPFHRRWLALLALVLVTSSHAQADAYPQRPITIVAPFSPGGNADIVARAIAQGMTGKLGQSVLVENKAGANAIIGAELVSRAAPDGYTILFGTAETHAINPHIYRKLSYDPVKQLTTVGVVDRFPFALVVSPSLPVDDLRGFVAYSKQNAGKLNYASWGIGSTSQIAFEQLKQVAVIDLLHIPFNGAAPAITAVSAGDVQALAVPLSVAVPQAASKRVKILAVLSANRDDSAPDVQTAKEQGFPVDIEGWHLLAVPAGTPPAIVEKLNRALNAVTSDAQIVANLRKQGVRPATTTTGDAAAMVSSESAHWGAVAAKAGVKVD